MIEVHHYGYGDVMVWAGIILEGRRDLHEFQGGTLPFLGYTSEILELYVRFARGAFFPWFIFIDENAHSHRTDLV